MFEGGISAARPRPHIRHLVAWLLAAAACSMASCSTPRPPATARHLVLVTIDTLRADRVGVYGASALTPRLDRIARGTMSGNAMTHVPLTRHLT